MKLTHTESIARYFCKKRFFFQIYLLFQLHVALRLTTLKHLNVYNTFLIALSYLLESIKEKLLKKIKSFLYILMLS